MPLYNNGFPIGYDPRVLNNPRPTPYANQALNQTPQVKNYITWVKGREEADAYMLGRNTVLPLWDSEDPLIYIKSTDEFGNPLPEKVLRYTVEQKKENNIQNQESQYVTRQDMEGMMDRFLDKFKEVMNGQSVVPGSTEPTTKSESNVSVIGNVYEKPVPVSESASKRSDTGAVSK